MERPERRHEDRQEPAGDHEQGQATTPEAASDDARKAELAERAAAVEGEASHEAEAVKKEVAETVWRRPVEFVNEMISDRIAPMLRRFFERFGALGDEEVPEGKMREARDTAKDAAERE